MKRRDPNAEAIVFRVLHLPEDLREGIQVRRKQQQRTLKLFVSEIITNGLAPLVQKLNEVLPNPTGTPRRPMRIPLSDPLLAELRRTANTTGIASTRLLLALLQLAAQESGRGRRGGRRKQVIKPPEEATPSESPESPQTEAPRRGRRKGTGGRKRKGGSSEGLDQTNATDANPAEPAGIDEFSSRCA